MRKPETREISHARTLATRKTGNREAARTAGERLEGGGPSLQDNTTPTGAADAGARAIADARSHAAPRHGDDRRRNSCNTRARLLQRAAQGDLVPAPGSRRTHPRRAEPTRVPVGRRRRRAIDRLSVCSTSDPVEGAPSPAGAVVVRFAEPVDPHEQHKLQQNGWHDAPSAQSVDLAGEARLSTVYHMATCDGARVNRTSQPTIRDVRQFNPWLDTHQRTIPAPFTVQRPDDDLAHLYETHAPSVRRQLLATTGASREAVEEAMQEAFTRYLAARRAGKNIRNVPAWWVRVARNYLQDERRRGRRIIPLDEDLENELVSNALSPEELAIGRLDTNPQRKRLAGYLAERRPIERTILILWSKDWTQAAIGALVGLRPQRVSEIQLVLLPHRRALSKKRKLRKARAVREARPA